MVRTPISAGVIAAIAVAPSPDAREQMPTFLGEISGNRPLLDELGSSAQQARVAEHVAVEQGGPHRPARDDADGALSGGRTVPRGEALLPALGGRSLPAPYRPPQIRKSLVRSHHARLPPSVRASVDRARPLVQMDPSGFEIETMRRGTSEQGNHAAISPLHSDQCARIECQFRKVDVFEGLHDAAVEGFGTVGAFRDRCGSHVSVRVDHEPHDDAG